LSSLTIALASKPGHRVQVAVVASRPSSASSTATEDGCAGVADMCSNERESAANQKPGRCFPVPPTAIRVFGAPTHSRLFASIRGFKKVHRKVSHSAVVRSILDAVDRAHQVLDRFGKHLRLETSHSNRKVFRCQKWTCGKLVLFLGNVGRSPFVQIYSPLRMKMNSLQKLPG